MNHLPVGVTQNADGGFNLECSSRGDKRFSAMCAYVDVHGKNMSIENAYQQAKVFIVDGRMVRPTSWRDVKGKQAPLRGLTPAHAYLHPVILDVACLTDIYGMLWCKYFMRNPDLLAYIEQFDTFSDLFRGKHTHNCQADVIAEIARNGLNETFTRYSRLTTEWQARQLEQA